jgi:hypothetical protein
MTIAGCRFETVLPIVTSNHLGHRLIILQRLFLARLKNRRIGTFAPEAAYPRTMARLKSDALISATARALPWNVIVPVVFQ